MRKYLYLLLCTLITLPVFAQPEYGGTGNPIPTGTANKVTQHVYQFDAIYGVFSKGKHVWTVEDSTRLFSPLVFKRDSNTISGYPTLTYLQSYVAANGVSSTDRLKWDTAYNRSATALQKNDTTNLVATKSYVGQNTFSNADRLKLDTAYNFNPIGFSYDSDSNDLYLYYRNSAVSSMTYQYQAYTADSNTVPSLGAQRYSASQKAVSYDYFLSPSGTPISVTQGDLDSFWIVLERFQTGGWGKTRVPANIAQTYQRSDYSFLISTKNIFNKATINTGRTLNTSTGALSSPTGNPLDVVSDYEIVAPGDSVRFSGFSSGYSKPLVWYDSLLNNISSNTGGSGATSFVFVAPVGAYRMRHAAGRAACACNDYLTIQVERQGQATQYENYRQNKGLQTIAGGKLQAGAFYTYDATQTYQLGDIVETSDKRVLESIKANNTGALTDATAWQQYILDNTTANARREADTGAWVAYKSWAYIPPKNMDMTYDTAARTVTVKSFPAASGAYLRIVTGVTSSGGTVNTFQIGDNTSAGYVIPLASFSRVLGKITYVGFYVSDSVLLAKNTGNTLIPSSSIVGVDMSVGNSSVRNRYFVRIGIYDGFANTWQSDFLTPQAQATAAKSGLDQYFDAWQAQPQQFVYRDIFSGANMAHYLEKRFKSDSDMITRVIMGDDSYIARNDFTFAAPVADSTASEPGHLTNNVYGLACDGAKPNGKPSHNRWNYPDYARFDNGTTYTETGSGWATVYNSTNWDNVDATVTPARAMADITVRQISGGGSVSFSFPAAYDRLNFLDKTQVGGSDSLQITVSSNTGSVMWRTYDTLAFAAINSGVLFSQANLPANATARTGNTQHAREIQLKKVGAAKGQAITVTITNLSSTKLFTYWGTERIKKNINTLKIINIARGGRDVRQLRNFLVTNCKNTQPDLYLREIPMTNNTSVTPIQIDTLVWLEEAFAFGQGPLADGISLYSLSAGWTKFSYQPYLPHRPSIQYTNPAGLPALDTRGLAFEQYYDAMKALYARYGIALPDMGDEFYYHAKANSRWRGNIRAINGDVLNPDDLSHLIPYGCKIYEPFINGVIYNNR